MNDYCVYIVPLPRNVRGAIRIDADGFASIYISDRLSDAEARATLRHELRHLYRGDMYSTRSIRAVERRRR